MSGISDDKKSAESSKIPDKIEKGESSITHVKRKSVLFHAPPANEALSGQPSSPKSTGVQSTGLSSTSVTSTGVSKALQSGSIKRAFPPGVTPASQPGSKRIKYPHVIDKKWATVPFPKMTQVDVSKFAITYDDVQKAPIDPKSALKDRTNTRSDERTSKASFVGGASWKTGSCKRPYVLIKKLPDGTKVKLDDSPAADTRFVLNQYQEVYERKRRTIILVVIFVILMMVSLSVFIIFMILPGRGRIRPGPSHFNSTSSSFNVTFRRPVVTRGPIPEQGNRTS